MYRIIAQSKAAKPLVSSEFSETPETYQVSPFIGAAGTEYLCNWGVGYLVSEGGKPNYFDRPNDLLGFTQAGLIHSWRAMKLLEKVEGIDADSLHDAWLCMSSYPSTPNKRASESRMAAKSFADPAAFEVAQLSIMRAYPNDEELGQMLRVVHDQEICIGDIGAIQERVMEKGGYPYSAGLIRDVVGMQADRRAAAEASIAARRAERGLPTASA